MYLYNNFVGAFPPFLKEIVSRSLSIIALVLTYCSLPLSKTVQGVINAVFGLRFCGQRGRFVRSNDLLCGCGVQKKLNKGIFYPKKKRNKEIK